MTTDMISQMDAMFNAARDCRVAERREIAGPTAPDFYVYRFYVDGERATTSQTRALHKLIERGAIYSESYAGTVGPAEVLVTC